MGLLRLLLAISIVIFHINPSFQPNLTVTRFAVPAFFVISGFFISKVLREKYLKHKQSYWLFLRNRLLRIYPTYWVVLGMLMIFSLAKYMLHVGGGDNAILHLLLLKPHVLISYLLANLSLLPIGPLRTESDKALGFLVGPQIWAVQIELIFYLVAPFLMKLPNKIVVIMMGIIILSIPIFDLTSKLKSIPVLSLFFSHFVYFYFGIVCYLIFNNRYNFELPVKIQQLDIFLGRLSYPIFVSHVFFIKLLKNIFPTQNQIFFSFSVFALTLLGSWIIVKLIEEPVYKLR